MADASLDRATLLAAADVELTQDDMREIDEALPEAQGDRYSEANQRMIDR